MNAPIVFEVCIDSVEGALAAARGGADRLELCSALSEGGITPSHGLVQRVRDTTSLPVMMMIRCRGGSFHYDRPELETMLADIEHGIRIGVTGFVFGALRTDATVDADSCRAILSVAGDYPVTFHRAFDEPGVDAGNALREIEQLGFRRLLTSGQFPSAVEGMAKISDFVTQVGELVIMPGAGVRPENAGHIIESTQAIEIHGTASEFCEESRRNRTSERTVRAIREALDR